MTDNVAILDGFTREVWGSCQAAEGPYLIKPDTDLDSAFAAWDMDSQEYVVINGWLWSFEDADD